MDISDNKFFAIYQNPFDSLTKITVLKLLRNIIKILHNSTIKSLLSVDFWYADFAKDCIFQNYIEQQEPFSTINFDICFENN